MHKLDGVRFLNPWNIMFADLCRPLRTFADLYGSLQTFADFQGPLRTFATMGPQCSFPRLETRGVQPWGGGLTCCDW